MRKLNLFDVPVFLANVRYCDQEMRKATYHGEEGYHIGKPISYALQMLPLDWYHYMLGKGFDIWYHPEQVPQALQEIIAPEYIEHVTKELEHIQNQ